MLGNTFDKVTQGGEGAVQSFDFYDLATGRGVKTLYCGDTCSGAAKYKMSPAQWYSETGSHVISYDTPITFEMALNKQLSLEGDGIVNIPVMHYNNTAGTVVLSGSLYCYLYHSGATSTLLGSGFTNVLSASILAYNSFYKMHGISFTVPTTILNAGSYLKIKVECSGADIRQVQVGCDPMGRTSATEMKPVGHLGWGTTTALTFQMPLRIDV